MGNHIMNYLSVLSQPVMVETMTNALAENNVKEIRERVIEAIKRKL